MHRAEQILEEIVARMQASPTIGVAPECVFKHRTLSIGEKDGEIPANTVNAGDDDPAPEYTEINGEIGSQLEVLTTAYRTADDEALLKSLLFEARAEIQKAINPPQKLGLSFVLMVEYGGASAMETDAVGEVFAGKYESRWLITYHSDETDPN